MNKDQKETTESAKVVRQLRAPRPEGRLLSHRVHFVSLQQEAEDYAPCIARAVGVSNVDAVVEMLRWFGGHLLRRASWAMQTATQKAIDEATNLIQDPDYYQTVRERRRRNRAREKLREQEQWEKRRNPPKPTLEEVRRQIKWASDEVARYAEWGASSAQRLKQLEETEAQLLSEIDADETVM